MFDDVAQVRAVDTVRGLVVRTAGNGVSGAIDGVGYGSRFTYPYAISGSRSAADGRVFYVADYSNRRVSGMLIMKIKKLVSNVTMLLKLMSYNLNDNIKEILVLSYLHFMYKKN